MYITSSWANCKYAVSGKLLRRDQNEERMSMVGVMMSENRAEGKISSHFGKAEWMMFVDTDDSVSTFQRNEAQNGKGAVAMVLQQGCTDVILSDIGDGALGHLQAAHVRAWAAPASITGSEALRMFKEGKLDSVPAARASTRHGGCHKN
jgi:predicted Fe-Mo cluster-binding NifX family protein